jgi:hypothetical protein
MDPEMDIVLTAVPASIRMLDAWEMSVLAAAFLESIELDALPVAPEVRKRLEPGIHDLRELPESEAYVIALFLLGEKNVDSRRLRRGNHGIAGHNFTTGKSPEKKL